MIRKYHNHTLQTNPRRHEEEPQYIYSNKISGKQKMQSNSSLFLVKMISELESNAHQNKEQHSTLTNKGSYKKTHNKSTTTESLP